MKKFLSVLSILFVILASVFIRNTHTSAETTKLTGIKLNDITIYTSFNNPSQKIVKKKVNDNETRIEFIDKNTGKVVEALGEINIPLSANDKVKSNSYLIKTIYNEKQIGLAKIRLSAQLKVYSDGKNPPQIKSIMKTFWNISSKEKWYLNKSHSNYCSTTGTFPAQKVQIIGNTVLEKKTIKRINSSSTTNYYERYPVEMSFNWDTVSGFK